MQSLLDKFTLCLHIKCLSSISAFIYSIMINQREDSRIAYWYVRDFLRIIPIQISFGWGWRGGAVLMRLGNVWEIQTIYFTLYINSYTN